MHLKSGNFIYPDEKNIEGSTIVFNSLLKKCIEKRRFMLCQKILRKNVPPLLVALYPQQEQLDENRMQITPSGFHLFYLPFAEDFRNVDQKISLKSI
jgi:ATP-dependent DNA helicase 2 subunit 1